MASTTGMETRSRTTRRTRSAAAVATALGLVATTAACGGSAADGPGGSTVVLAVAVDPGTLSPTTALASTALSMNSFAYDTLVHIAADGSLVPGVAEKWSATSTSAQFTIRSGVTCEDGSPLTADDVAAQYNHIADPKNQSPMLGLSVPVTAVAKADKATRTVTVTTKKPASFLVQMARLLPLVCKKSLAAPAALAKATNASGPYRLSEAVPGDHYTYVKRDGYAWGPRGSTGAGLPGKVVFKVVANESTAANLLMAGQINGALINGADQDRLDAAEVKNESIESLFGQLVFNQAAGRPGADLAVRKALVSVLDLKQLRNVATGGKGKPPTRIGETVPTPCTGDTVTGNLPAHDTAQAAAALTAAGWAKSGGIWTKDGRPLTVGLSYSTNGGAQATARAVDRLGAVRIPSPERRARQRPHEYSGGMRQRAVIAMGLMGEPKLIIADEPTTALDVAVQQQVLDLLAEVREGSGAALLLISHDLAVVAQVCARVLVMYGGLIVEDLPVAELAGGAAHPYPRALAEAVPTMATDPGRELATIPGRPPEPGEAGPGCAFAPRCERARERCHGDAPELADFGPGRRVACWYPVDAVGAGAPVRSTSHGAEATS
ncbi:ATP-binding cassette domain-containing protein [Streptomyces inhibens]|uniref:ATP-binding cassette domain-containing protein n=1 Tax=Streptomyces inhibens TaxID=2293571 RepID=A0A371Q7W5_STRIH|nr:oligopeptide/dipeptide ABC transporter ATP-binding protein [Streptomyces inhibens]REK90761.1 ATP-binding cassette domain-containing protein [Streptomyces inhibens]